MLKVVRLRLKDVFSQKWLFEDWFVVLVLGCWKDRLSIKRIWGFYVDAIVSSNPNWS